jgi:hypothetical protein
MKKNIFKDETEHAQALNESLSLKMKEQNPYILQIHDYEVYIKKDFCSKAYYFSIFFDYPEQDLSGILVEQINSKKNSSGEHLLKIIYNVLSGLKYLNSLSQIRDSGLLQLDRIYYNPESNDYRVMENITNIKIYDYYFNMKMKKDKFSVFSPETLLKRPLIDKKFDLSKTDCFNLGIIILCFGLNLLPKIFYQKGEINQTVLTQKKAEFDAKYKQYSLLCDLVQDVLTLNVKQRPSVTQVLEKYPDNTNLREYQLSSIKLKSRVSLKKNSASKHKRPSQAFNRNICNFLIFF